MSSALLQPKPQGYGSAQDASVTGRKAPVASFFSRALFSFATPTMQLGNERQLHTSDLWALEGANQTSVAFASFNAQFARNEDNNNSNRSVLRAMGRTYGGSFLLCGLGALFSTACNLFAPLVLHHVIDAFTTTEMNLQDLALWLGAFFASRLVNAIVDVQMKFYLELVALRLTVALKALLFQKAMRRSVKSKNEAKTVDLANLYTSDVNNILWAAYEVNNLWLLPVQIGAMVYMLYDVLGLAAVAGLAVIAVSMVMSLVIAKFSGHAFDDVMLRKDERMKVVKEVFGAIQIVKLNAWELQFADKIHNLRAHELSAVARVLYWGALSIFVLWVSPLVVSTVSFAVYAITMGQILTAAKVFTAMALFNALREPLRDLPDVIQQFIQAKVALERISEFLVMHEYEISNVQRDVDSQHEDVAIAVESGCFGWNTRDSPLLKNVSLTVKKGDLVVVYGTVGAGKSSLCSALLGEMDKLSGKVFLRGTVAYYSQQPWLQHTTIRANILFGSAYEPRKYRKVLDACGLVQDLAQLPGGDASEIGQRGVNLSGGQRARVCLARACYADAEIFILDSPLAAVDAVVQSEIFAKCICGLLANKTVVLVTHNPAIIASEAANFKIRVQDGELKGERKDFDKPRGLYAPKLSARQVQEAHEHETGAVVADAGRLVQDEEREEGRVSKSVFMEYLNALGGIRVLVFLVVVQVLWQGFRISSDLWLSHWTGSGAGEKLKAYTKSETESNMRIYAYLGFGAALMVLARTLTVSFVGLRASRHLFNAMTRSLLSAPLRFFDATPIGRIVNRYGDDMATVDDQLPFAFGSVLANTFATVCQLATAVYMVQFLGILILPLIVLYVNVAAFYLAPSRAISRLWKVSASPILSHISECEEGVTTIRAFGSQYVARMVDENFNRIDVNNRVWFAECVTNLWFQVRMQLLGAGVVIVVVSALVYLRAFLSPGLVGLAFTYALSVDNGLSRLVQAWSSVEITMISPERILEYANIPPEGSDKLLVLEPPPQWPHKGAIEFQDVMFSYKLGAPAVLKGLSFAINASEKIGIVGRTGAGKSSLTMALFRINELDSGRILIDGEDIASVPLRSLRSRLSIIPQAPVLFRGTLRAYMDPFNAFSDAEIWLVLTKVEMKTQVGTLEGQLLYELSENGENLSVGERQLLCLARALLTQAHIVVMDEATAAIDHATEHKLQEMVAREFANATVLTIAHRLATVLDSDRILVLSDGRVVEFDSPQSLVKNADGVFYKLAKEGGCLDRLLL